MGLINSGYTMELISRAPGPACRRAPSSRSAHGRRACASPRTSSSPGTPGVWYRMKLRVDQDGDKALIRGKVWPRGEDEPEAWSITVEDPLPIRAGSAGLSGYSPSAIYYDNVQVSENDQ